MTTAWLGRRALRARLVLGGGGVVVAALLYAGLARPPATAVRPPIAAVVTRVADPMSPIVTSAAAARLPIRRILAQGAGVRVVMENVGFDRALAWLTALDRSGIDVVAIDVARRADPGRVDVDVTLRPAGE